MVSFIIEYYYIKDHNIFQYPILLNIAISDFIAYHDIFLGQSTCYISGIIQDKSLA